MLLFVQSITFFLISFIAAIFTGLYFYVTRNFNFWQKLGVPYVKPTPFFGTLKDCVLLKTTIGQQLQRIYNEHSDKPYVGIFSFDKPSLLICDLELVKNILVKDFQTFKEHVLSFDEKSDPLLGNTLPGLKGKLWRHLRTNFTPVFTSGKMKKMFYLVDTCGKELADCLHRATADGSTVEVKETMARFTTDVIASCAFGINSNSLKDPDSEFGRRIRTIFDFSVQKGLAILTAFFSPFLKSFFRLKVLDHNMNNYLRQIVWSTVEHREKHGLVRNDFLDCLMELRKGGKNEAQEDMHSANTAKKGPSFGSTVEVKETMARFTTDVIASCAFGINSNSQKDPDSEFGRNIRNVFTFSVKKGLAMLFAWFAPSLNKIFRLNFVEDKTNKYVRQIVWNTVECREKHGLVRNDFLDCMMELRQASKDEAKGDVQSTEKANTGATFKIDGDLFVAQALTFLAAGYETSASTLTFALYELALHPEIQHSLRAEILQVLSNHDGELTYDGIQDMLYLDRVVSETLRKYPILPFLERKCCIDYELPAPTGTGTIKLPGGTGVYIPVLGIHYDPKYFPEPEKFDPDRFREENKRSRPNYTYIPFGEGPRMCIGMRFGLMQVKTGLCHILSRFEVAPCKETPVRIVYEASVLLQMSGEFRLSFNRM